MHSGRAYDLLQSLCGTETSRARTDDKNIDVAAEDGISCWSCWWCRCLVLMYISLPLALLMVRLWVWGPLASLEGVLGIV